MHFVAVNNKTVSRQFYCRDGVSVYLRNRIKSYGIHNSMMKCFLFFQPSHAFLLETPDCALFMLTRQNCTLHLKYGDCSLFKAGGSISSTG